MNVLPRRPGMDAVSSERRFQLLVDRVRDYAIFMLDPQGVVSSWNAGAQRFKGYTAGEIIGQHFSCFYSPEDQQAGAPQQALAIALAEGMFETEGWRVRKDGSRFWASVVIDPIRDETGTLIGFAKVTRDITERKAAEKALRRAMEEAERANLAKSKFLAAASHDLRQPLQSLILFAGVLKGYVHGPRGEQALAHLERGLDALKALLDSLLDVS